MRAVSLKFCSWDPNNPSSFLAMATCLNSKETELVFVLPRDKSFDEFMKDFDRWEDGAMVQEAFPYLDASTREFFMTGITPEAWQELFGGNE